MRFAFFCLIGFLVAPLSAAEPKPVPKMQAVPLPEAQVSFQRDGVEIARLHFGSHLRRPFVFPVIGPSGRHLTRMGHPQDPVGHSHHNSIWLSHMDIDKTNFWADFTSGKIVHDKIEKFEDTDTHASVLATYRWMDEKENKVRLLERRRTAVAALDKGEWLLILDIRFEAPEAATLGKTPFGLLGVRMTKTIGVRDGGGTIRNAAGGVDEKEVFWKASKWCDYSGPVADKVLEGVTIFDHPKNPNHPSVYHVRNDGWMGASLTFDGPRTIEPGKPLSVRYGIYVHAGMPSVDELNRKWDEFAKTDPIDLTPAPPKKK
jgi:hypothetical protein